MVSSSSMQPTHRRTPWSKLSMAAGCCPYGACLPPTKPPASRPTPSPRASRLLAPPLHYCQWLPPAPMKPQSNCQVINRLLSSFPFPSLFLLFLFTLLLFLSPLSLSFAIFLLSLSKFRAFYAQGEQCTTELYPQPLLILGTLGSAFLTKLPFAPQTAHYSIFSHVSGPWCLEGKPHVV